MYSVSARDIKYKRNQMQRYLRTLLIDNEKKIGSVIIRPNKKTQITSNKISIIIINLFKLQSKNTLHSAFFKSLS